MKHCVLLCQSVLRLTVSITSNYQQSGLSESWQNGFICDWSPCSIDPSRDMLKSCAFSVVVKLRSPSTVHVSHRWRKMALKLQFTAVSSVWQQVWAAGFDFLFGLRYTHTVHHKKDCCVIWRTDQVIYSGTLWATSSSVVHPSTFSGFGMVFCFKMITGGSFRPSPVRAHTTVKCGFWWPVVTVLMIW